MLKKKELKKKYREPSLPADLLREERVEEKKYRHPSLSADPVSKIE